MILVRLNNIPWFEAKNRSVAAHRLNCGWYDNGLFDLNCQEIFSTISKARQVPQEIKDEASKWGNDEIESLILTYGNLNDD